MIFKYKIKLYFIKIDINNIIIINEVLSRY